MTTNKHIAIIGASGAIGHALTLHYARQSNHNLVTAFTRNQTDFPEPNIQNICIDFDDEKNLAHCAANDSWDIVIIAIGILTDEMVSHPEKSVRHLSQHSLSHLYQVNTIYPSLVAKHFLEHLSKKNPSVLAILSARVGSIGDNHKGGWHAYRASKAALNMLIKNFALEMKWRNKQATVLGLHPGTVASRLSKPFQDKVLPEHLFSPEQAASYLVTVIEQALPAQSGTCLAWDGSLIEP